MYAIPHSSSLSLSLSLSTVLRQVVLGLPLFLFPSGVHDKDIYYITDNVKKKFCHHDIEIKRHSK